MYTIDRTKNKHFFYTTHIMYTLLVRNYVSCFDHCRRARVATHVLVELYLSLSLSQF